jgi:hypothetical protein
MDLSNFISGFIKDPETALLIVSYAFAIYGFYKGWIVPKFIYDLAEARAKTAEASLKDITEALRNLTTEVRQRTKG